MKCLQFVLHFLGHQHVHCDHIPFYGRCNKVTKTRKDIVVSFRAMEGNLQSFSGAEYIDKRIGNAPLAHEPVASSWPVSIGPVECMHVQHAHKVSEGCPEMPSKSPLKYSTACMSICCMLAYSWQSGTTAFAEATQCAYYHGGSVECQKFAHDNVLSL